MRSQQQYFTISKNGDGLYHDRSGKLSFQEVVPDKLQPHNIAAEQAVLGALLIDSDAIIRIGPQLSPADFFLERHGWVFEAIQKLHDDRKAADFLTLSDELERQDRLEDVGGQAWLTGLINATPTALYVEHYAAIVARSAVLRRLINGASEIARIAYADDIEAQEAIDKAEQVIFGVAKQGQRDNMVHIRAALDRYNDRLEMIQQNKGKVVGIPTGLTDLDRLLGGLQRSDMVIVAGRPSMGKTSLSIDIARNASKKWGVRSAIFSLEMSEEQLVQRLIAAESGIDAQRLRLGDIKDDEWGGYLRATDTLSKMQIYIDDSPAISSSYLRQQARRLHAEQGLDLLIVDYLQLMRGDSRKESRQVEMSDISRSIKALARELNIPILALSQLSRACESRADKRPMLSDLRESGSLEQDADVVLFIYRDEVYNPDTEFVNLAEILVSKHRQGPTGVFSVYFKKSLCQFVNLEIRRQSLDYMKE